MINASTLPGGTFRFTASRRAGASSPLVSGGPRVTHGWFTAIVVLALCFSAGRAAAADADPVKTRELIGVLQSSADVFQRARACQQLAILGTKDAVPALATLLGDEKLGQYARDALEVMPDPTAADALREALDRLKGNALLGVMNSLAMRRDAQSVPALGKLSFSRR